MATRFYLPASGNPPFTPSVGSGWTASGSSVVRPMSTVKSQTAMASTTIAVDNSSSTASTLFVRFISPMLAAQTISGNLTGQALFSIANATGATTVSRIQVTIVNSAGTVQSTLLAGTSGAATLTTTATNKNVPASVALSSQTCAAGDRVVVEMGIIRTAGTTARNGTIVFGDNAASDLAIDTTTTTQNNPWVEFSGNLTFFPTKNLGTLEVG